MPLEYTGPADILAQLILLYRGAVPSDMASQDRDLDEAHAYAEMMLAAEGEAIGWAREARLGTSHGIWTDQHGKDRGLTRQGGEPDPEFIARLRTSPKAITEQSLRDAIEAVIAATGATGPDAAFYLVAIPVTHGAFVDIDAWVDADSRVTPYQVRVTVAIIPAALNIKAGVIDAMRSKMPAGHAFFVEEWS